MVTSKTWANRSTKVEAGLVVVAVSDMEAKVRSAMKRAHKIEEKQLKADQKEIEADAAEAQKS